MPEPRRGNGGAPTSQSGADADAAGGDGAGRWRGGVDWGHELYSHSAAGHAHDEPTGGRGAGHHHHIAAGGDRRPMLLALALIAGFMAVEVVAGFLAGSLALLADAGHMLTDVGAIAAAIGAARIAARPARGMWTFGYHRAEILSAAGNGVALIVIAIVIGIEAGRRLAHPPPVAGWAVLAVALVGVAVNVAATRVLARANRDSLNVEGAFQHILTDLFAFLATAVAGIVVVTTGWLRADAVASFVVVALMLRAAWGLLRDAGTVLLEAAPADVDLDDVRRHLCDVTYVRGIHDLHVWTVTSNLPVLSAHVVVDDACLADGSAGALLDQLQGCLSGHFDVEHSTLQIESVSHADHEGAAHA